MNNTVVQPGGLKRNQSVSGELNQYDGCSSIKGSPTQSRNPHIRMTYPHLICIFSPAFGWCALACHRKLSVEGYTRQMICLFIKWTIKRNGRH